MVKFWSCPHWESFPRRWTAYLAATLEGPSQSGVSAHCRWDRGGCEQAWSMEAAWETMKPEMNWTWAANSKLPRSPIVTNCNLEAKWKSEVLFCDINFVSALGYGHQQLYNQINQDANCDSGQWFLFCCGSSGSAIGFSTAPSGSGISSTAQFFAAVGLRNPWEKFGHASNSGRQVEPTSIKISTMQCIMYILHVHTELKSILHI